MSFSNISYNSNSYKIAYNLKDEFIEKNKKKKER